MRPSPSPVKRTDRDPLEWAREHTGRSFSRFDMRRDGDRPYFFAARTLSLPGFNLTRLNSSATEFSVRSDDCGRISLCFVLNGGGTMRHRMAEYDHHVGDAVVMWDFSQDNQLRFVTGTRMLSVNFPVSQLRHRTVGLRPGAWRADGRSPGMGLLRRYLPLAEKQLLDQSSPVVAEMMSDLVYDLAALALGASRDGVEMAHRGGLRTAWRLHAKDLVERHLLDPELDAAFLCRALGVSESYLAKLFADEETSVARYIATRRATRARQLLVDPGQAGIRIIDIALQCGFDDLSTFNRTFRRTFGMAPSELRTVSAA